MEFIIGFLLLLVIILSLPYITKIYKNDSSQLNLTNDYPVNQSNKTIKEKLSDYNVFKKEIDKEVSKLKTINNEEQISLEIFKLYKNIPGNEIAENFHSQLKNDFPESYPIFIAYYSYWKGIPLGDSKQYLNLCKKHKEEIFGSLYDNGYPQYVAGRWCNFQDFIKAEGLVMKKFSGEVDFFLNHFHQALGPTHLAVEFQFLVAALRILDYTTEEEIDKLYEDLHQQLIMKDMDALRQTMFGSTN